MNWELKEATYGDMIRVNMGDYYHYAIYADENRIIQFGEPQICYSPEDVTVEETTVKEFLNGKFMEVAVFNKQELLNKKTPDEIVTYAINCLGQKGYDILNNNCEHFANKCVFGKSKCSQIEDVRAEIIKKLFIPKIYIASINHKFDYDYTPQILLNELKNITNEALIKQKQQVYNLLYYIFSTEFKQTLSDNAITKNEFGKPIVADYEISFSHANDVVAVAVSKDKIGVDIEQIDDTKNIQKLVKRIDSSLNETSDANSIYDIWCKKEAVFKMLGNQINFVPLNINLSNYNCKTQVLDIIDKQYILSWAIDAEKNTKIVKV